MSATANFRPFGAEVCFEPVSSDVSTSSPAHSRPATPATLPRCIYSPVSVAGLQKTGILLCLAGDFREFAVRKARLRAFGDYRQREKPTFGGPCLSRKEYSSKTGMAGWGGRDRTSEWRNQNPLPYRLATPQQAAPGERGWPPRGFPPATPVYRGRCAISTGWRLIFGAPASCAGGLLYNAFRDGACPGSGPQKSGFAASDRRATARRVEGMAIS